jgi:KDO2-lipid IV(A) lauroyltransferase
VAPHPAYAAYRAGSAVARALPAGAVEPFCRATGRVAAAAMAERRHMVERHQRRVRPELTDQELRGVVRRTFASYAHYWVESFRLPGTDPETLDRGLRPEGFEHIERAVAAGNGCILAMPHLGAWEWSAFWLTTFHGYPVTAVVEAVEPPELAAWFTGLRTTLGMEVVPLDGSAGTASTRALRANRVLALLCDRDVAGGGVEVEFFGERTTLPAGPATLALRTGAPIVPATTYFDDDRGHHGVARPPLDTARRGKLRDDVARITQDIAHELEAMIRHAPEQWHLLQPNWPSDREDG